MKFHIEVFKIERFSAVLTMDAADEAQARRAAQAALDQGMADWTDAFQLDEGIAEIVELYPEPNRYTEEQLRAMAAAAAAAHNPKED
jgi:hypothetical protein